MPAAPCPDSTRLPAGSGSDTIIAAIAAAPLAAPFPALTGAASLPRRARASAHAINPKATDHAS